MILILKFMAAAMVLSNKIVICLKEYITGNYKCQFVYIHVHVSVYLLKMINMEDISTINRN